MMKQRAWWGLALLLLAGPAFARVGGGDVKMESKGEKPAAFSHEIHVSGAGLSCTDCHAGLYTTRAQHKAVSMDAMKKGQSCGACHNGKKAFAVDACDKCHR